MTRRSSRPGRPVRAGLLALLVTLALVVPVGAAVAAGPSVADPTPGDAASSPAAAVLARAAAAPDTVAYQGLQRVRATTEGGALVRLVRVVNVPGRGVLVTTPEGAEEPTAGFLPSDATATPADLLTLLQASHLLVLLPDDTVAGRLCQVVEATSPAGTTAARYWVDRATGVLLRRDVFDSSGAVARSTVFVVFTPGPVTVSGHLPPMPPMSTTTSTALTAADLDAWRAQGYPCPQQLAGLPLYEARRLEGTAEPVVHLVYSDGLDTMSLFVQDGRLDPSGLDGYTERSFDGVAVRVREGLPEQVTWTANDQVLALVADAPDETVEAAVAALPHDPPPRSFWGRVEHGAARVLSWLNPFG